MLEVSLENYMLYFAFYNLISYIKCKLKIQFLIQEIKCKSFVLQIEVISTVKNRSLGKIYVDEDATVKNIKLEIAKKNSNLYVERQSIRSASKGKDLKDNATVESLKLRNGSKIYVKDLGPQISWRLVFLCEYLGPLLVYLIFVYRPWLFYGSKDETWTFSLTAQ